MKADTMETRVRAMVKRLLQVAVNDSAPFAAGILVLVSKLAEERPNVIMLKRLSSMAELQSPKSAATAVNEDDDEEIYVDLDDEGKPIKPIKSEIVKKEVENDVKPDKDKLQKAGGGKNGQGWVHKNNQAHRGAISIYSSEARNPLKAITSTKIIRRKVYDPWGVKKLKIASREYLMKKQEEIPADERFLHRFATLKFQPKEADKTKDEDWDEIGSVNSEEMDRLLEKRKEKPQKRKAEESDGEDDDLLEDGLSEDEDGGDEDDVEDEDEDDWDDEDVEMEGDESDEEDDGGLFSRKTSKKKGGMDDESDDEDFGDADAFVSADRFAEMLEEGGEDEVNKKIRKKIKKPKGFKKRR
ncbi:unnamed protein product, partial [Mesorhabditis belari]|uniref:CCAAT-binding factor domain-containing protein n=1 Tax=Mesorhabditis belari TaxID=2138241 RepID=A0AAF3FPS5_9BILA